MKNIRIELGERDLAENKITFATYEIKKEDKNKLNRKNCLTTFILLLHTTHLWCICNLK